MKYTAYNTSTIRDKTGRPMFREKEQEDRWIECVEEVLNRPPPEVAADIPPAEVDSEVSVDAPSKGEIISPSNL